MKGGAATASRLDRADHQANPRARPQPIGRRCLSCLEQSDLFARDVERLYERDSHFLNLLLVVLKHKRPFGRSVVYIFDSLELVL